MACPMHESSFTSIHDLADSQIMDILHLAEEFEQDRSGYSDLGKGLIMGSLFMEPSTRTRGRLSRRCCASAAT